MFSSSHSVILTLAADCALIVAVEGGWPMGLPVDVGSRSSEVPGVIVPKAALTVGFLVDNFGYGSILVYWSSVSWLFLRTVLMSSAIRCS